MKVTKTYIVNNNRHSFRNRETSDKNISKPERDSFIKTIYAETKVNTATDNDILVQKEKDYAILEENLLNLKDKKNVPYLLLYQLKTNKAILDVSKESGGMEVELKSDPSKNSAELLFKFADKQLKITGNDYNEARAKSYVSIFLNKYINDNGKELFLKDVEEYMKNNRPFWKKLFSR